jgi:hypothetical protein
MLGGQPVTRRHISLRSQVRRILAPNLDHYASVRSLSSCSQDEECWWQLHPHGKAARTWESLSTALSSVRLVPQRRRSRRSMAIVGGSTSTRSVRTPTTTCRAIGLRVKRHEWTDSHS